MTMTPDEVVSNLTEYGTIKALSSVVMLQSAITLLQDYQKLREKIKDKDNRLWAIIRCNACNGTTDCENSPECPENYDGCIADDILKEMQTYLQQPTEH